MTRRVNFEFSTQEGALQCSQMAYLNSLFINNLAQCFCAGFHRQLCPMESVVCGNECSSVTWTRGCLWISPNDSPTALACPGIRWRVRLMQLNLTGQIRQNSKRNFFRCARAVETSQRRGDHAHLRARCWSQTLENISIAELDLRAAAHVHACPSRGRRRRKKRRRRGRRTVAERLSCRLLSTVMPRVRQTTPTKSTSKNITQLGRAGSKRSYRGAKTITRTPASRSTSPHISAVFRLFDKVTSVPKARDL